MDQRLRRIERLQCAGEFRRVFDTGRVAHSRCLRIHYASGATELSRVGLVVTRKMGKAVARTRIKRLLREVYRTQKRRLPRTLDVVFVARGGVWGFADYLEAFDRFVAQAGREASASERAKRDGGGREPPQAAAHEAPRAPRREPSVIVTREEES